MQGRENKQQSEREPRLKMQKMALNNSNRLLVKHEGNLYGVRSHGGTTFKWKSELFISIVSANRRAPARVRGPDPRRQLLQPVQGRETDGSRGRGRAGLQG